MTGVQLFVEPDDGTQPVVQFLNQASRSLDIAMYLLSDRSVISAITAAQRRGVKVRVMLEEHPYGNGPGNEAVYRQLEGAGIGVAWSPANFALSHDKYAIADQKQALVGTPNWTHDAFTANREYVVVDDNAGDVSQLAALFSADWTRQAPEIDNPNLVVSPINSRTDVLGLIASAQRSLMLEDEEMQDDQVVAALVAAARRGVAVQVILPLTTGGPDANAAGRSTLVAGGVQVKRLAKYYVHAKDLIVDGREGFVGSENISRSSFDQNREVGLLLGDANALEKLTTTFRQDWSDAQS